VTGNPPLPSGGLPWLSASGPESHLVISTRVRLARNLSGRAFWGRNSIPDRDEIVRSVADAASGSVTLGDAVLYRLDALPRASRLWLHERQLVSRDLAGLDAAGRVRSGAALLLGQSASIMINEEDHLRLQTLRSGFDLDVSYAETDRVDNELGLRLSFAFHPEFGYLTSCPTNVGTGLRASVMIHLPGLVLTKEIGKVLQGLSQVGLTYRGLYGEGSEVLGNVFQLSNQTTLGKSEGELLDHLGRLVRQVVEYEMRAREVLRRDAAAALEDKVWRAYGLLRHARSLSFEETLNLLSGVRLGVGMGVLPAVPLRALNQLLVQAQTAHVAAQAQVDLEDDTIPVERATLVRRLLEEEVPQ
jgi:protein arginine kinase